MAAIGSAASWQGTVYHDMGNLNSSDMASYLNVDMQKLRSKGVDSVRSRVANLIEFKPDISVAMMREALLRSFSQVYVLPVTKIDVNKLPEDEITTLMKRFKS